MRLTIATAPSSDVAAATAALFAVRDALQEASDEVLLLAGDEEGLVLDGPVGDPEVRRLLASTCDLVADHRLPVIGAASGPLRGGGLELLLACDLRYVRSGETLSLPGHEGAPLPVGGLQRLVRLGGSSLATRMLILGEQPVAGSDPAIGRFADAVASPVAAAAAALDALEKAGPLAVEAMKTALAAAVELPLAGGLAVEADLACLLLPTADRAEGLAAQREKRPPSFEGR